jgi:predicted  nucleic acid-binding Zn-ribbon protein
MNKEVIDQITAIVRASESRLVIDGIKDTLQHGIESLEARFDDQAARLDRQAGLMQSGGRAIVRLDQWSDSVDKSLERKDQAIAELRERIAKLEARVGGE